MDKLSSEMAKSVGYHSRSGIPFKQLGQNVCAVCGLDTQQINDIPGPSLGFMSTLLSYLQFQGRSLVSNKRIELECKHVYHESCIR